MTTSYTIDDPKVGPALATVALVAASDANYFHLLSALVKSIKADPVASQCGLCILDLGLDDDHLVWLNDQGATIVEPQMDFDFKDKDRMPRHYLGMLARPFLPRYFPGFDVYMSIDADTWVQDGSVIRYFARAASEGKLAIVPETDRSYFTTFKRPKLMGWGASFRAHRFAFGLMTADKMAGKPLCNAGVFALHKDAPHWDLYSKNLNLALNRKRAKPLDTYKGAWLLEQAALNQVIYVDKAPVAMLPAYCNWFCALATPHFDPDTGFVVEPNEPHRPLAIVHLAGKGVQERSFALPVRGKKGETKQSMLTYDAIKGLSDPGLTEPKA